MKTTLPYCLIILLILSCCGKTDNRAHLDSINAIAETDGRLALSMLDSVKGRDYNTTDEIYYDFLMVKARDNANVVHTNDSLIKRVIVFYGDNGSERYAEALYYGGRVYEDLGDYPASLKYYHKALDKLPDDKDPGGLRRNVLRRQARLLIEKRLYSQAVPYIDEVIKFDESEDDNMNLPFDYELLVQA
ncbi:MAG: tetratricopeptide repeat protein, partial [Muribaculaceae bacterium]|nr:tetratricopeptide repeat protein [Muribaculaceae bacterium]